MPPTEEGLLAVAALQKLTDTQAEEPTPAELAALELMIRMTRPAPLLHKGRPDNIRKIEQSEIFPAWAAFQDSIQPYSHAIGRIDRAGKSSAASQTVGTGFLISTTQLLTNKHVLMELSRGTGALQEGQGVVRFQWEDDSFAPDAPVPILGVIAVHATLDAVLLRVKDRSLSVTQQLPKISEAELSEETDVVVIGYPANDSERNPLFVRAIFGSQFEVLRALPGQLTDLHETGFSHDCSTLGGNSGSPVFSMATAMVIGLHRSGSFLWRNEAIGGRLISEFIKDHVGRER
jgi:V8-like Glu-specific endopeptidase